VFTVLQDKQLLPDRAHCIKMKEYKYERIPQIENGGGDLWNRRVHLYARTFRTNNTANHLPGLHMTHSCVSGPNVGRKSDLLADIFVASPVPPSD
jgi:hypothetical protein